jgi:hypothetical protein
MHFKWLTFVVDSGKTEWTMSQWNIKASTLFILSCVVFLMLLIVVLPDVDLPDTAFHRGTAPVLVHARATAAPSAVIVSSIAQSTDSSENSDPVDETRSLAFGAEPNFRPILLRSIRR